MMQRTSKGGTIRPATDSEVKKGLTTLTMTVPSGHKIVFENCMPYKVIDFPKGSKIAPVTVFVNKNSLESKQGAMGLTKCDKHGVDKVYLVKQGGTNPDKDLSSDLLDIIHQGPGCALERKEARAKRRDEMKQIRMSETKATTEGVKEKGLVYVEDFVTSALRAAAAREEALRQKR